MKTFTIEDIRKQREDFKSAGFQTFSLQHRGNWYDSFLLPDRWTPPELPYIVMRMTLPLGDPMLRQAESMREVTLFGVSESVSEHVRAFPIHHEIEEFVHLGLAQKRHCCRAAAYESDLVERSQLDPEQRRAYFISRAEFFEGLIAYALSRRDQFSSDDISEFRDSLAHFRRAVVVRV